MTVLVTGAAGFIGFHVTQALLERGEVVIGIDDLNSYYDVSLKEQRLATLGQNRCFAFYKADIADREAVSAIFGRHPQIDRIIHLAAQAGVRYSLTNPFAYVHANLLGQVTILEAARASGKIAHLVYASSSSVYGDSSVLPFSLEDPVDKPRSLYGATKRADELISRSYAALFGMPLTGLRFFTVYGPWGRPDMSAYIFTKAILAGEPITLFNNGQMKRDFTYVDDIVAGVLAALDRCPAVDATGVRHKVYNLGNHRSEPLMRFVEIIEKACGRKAVTQFAPMQPGDVVETYADIGASQRDLGFTPKTSIDDGIPRFVSWFCKYHNLR
jgi:UDP-glucuronate 4-epimerase